MLRKKPTFYVAVAGVIATIVMAVHLHGQSPVTPPPIDPSPKPYELSVAASGIIEALSENVSIGVPEAGLVTKVHVKVWDSIKEGRALFTLDDREISARSQVNIANARVALATVRRLEDQLSRLKGVNDPRAVSQDEVRTKENDVAVAQAQLEAAQAQVGQDLVCLARLTVRAPRDGTVLQVNVRPGEYASATPKNAGIFVCEVRHRSRRGQSQYHQAARQELNAHNSNAIMNHNQAVAFLKTPGPALYPSSPRTEKTAGERGPYATSILRPRPVGTFHLCCAPKRGSGVTAARGEGNGWLAVSDHGNVRRTSRGSFAIALGSVVILFAGCAVGPNYCRPTVGAPTAWKETAITTSATVLPIDWWTIFDDAELNSLETQAVEANQDLKRAVARVAEARALARVSKSELYPSVSANGAYSRNRVSESRANAPLHHFESDDFSTSFDLNYELDMWGRVRRSVEAANADAAAVATDLQVVLLTLTAEVARNYQSLRSLDNEKLVIQATIALRKDTLQLQETRNQAGLINEVDVTRARTELANVEAELHAIVRSRAQIEHALAVLCGQPPASFTITARASNTFPPEVPAGLPSELLQRRPDIVEAEQSLAAASARIGVAKAAFFPTIKLTGAAGLASADLGTLVDWPSRVWSVGPSISVPIFQGGRNRANLKATEARYEQSVASYRGTILNAFREVEDALSDLATLSSQGEAVNRALVSARDTATLANERYQKGLSSYLDVVDAQRAALQAERQDTQLRGQRAISTILLAKSLGGGWERDVATQFAGSR